MAGIIKRRISKWLLITLFLSGCSSSPVIYTDYDHTVNFANYQTYAFFEEEDPKSKYTSLQTKHIRDAVISEMNHNGYRYNSQQPEIRVNIKAVSKEKQRIWQSAAPSIGYMGSGYYPYGYGYNPWYGFGGGYGYRSYVDYYKQLTITIDLIDTQLNQTVWEGKSSSYDSRGQNPNNSRPFLTKKVKQIFSHFPPQKQLD